MRNLEHLEKNRVKHPVLAFNPGGKNGYFIIRYKEQSVLNCMASDGFNWDHVSVTVNGEKRCPSWEEMVFVKSLFFDFNETAVQFHPRDDEYINIHPYCLHLWRYQKENYQLPPHYMI